MKSKPLMLLFSFLIAFGLWAYVVTVVSPESEETFHDVPVILSGTSVLAERDLMILSDTQMTVDLKLMGNRMDLAKLNSGNITVLADLSQITDPGTHSVKYAISYPGGIQSGNIEVLEREPQYLTVEVVERGYKEIPVIPVYDIEQLPDGYWTDDSHIHLNYNFITIAGPKDVVNQIDHAKINIDLTEKTSIFAENYRLSLCNTGGIPLQDVSSITVNISAVQATVNVLKIREIPIRVELRDGDLISADQATATPSIGSLQVVGKADALALLGNEIVLTVDLNGKYEDFTESFQLTLPDGITLLEGDTNVAVQVKLPQIKEHRFTFGDTQIQYLNVPKGYNICSRADVEIVVRGVAQVVDGLDASDFVITVDCYGITENTTKLFVTITLRDQDGVMIVQSPAMLTVLVTRVDEPFSLKQPDTYQINA